MQAHPLCTSSPLDESERFFGRSPYLGRLEYSARTPGSSTVIFLPCHVRRLSQSRSRSALSWFHDTIRVEDSRERHATCIELRRRFNDPRVSDDDRKCRPSLRTQRGFFTYAVGQQQSGQFLFGCLSETPRKMTMGILGRYRSRVKM